MIKSSEVLVQSCGPVEAEPFIRTAISVILHRNSKDLQTQSSLAESTGYLGYSASGGDPR